MSQENRPPGSLTPTVTGIVGGISFVIVAVLCLASLRKGQPR